ncbi:iron ABC transporter permease [Roseateles sp. DAIF2]|nr:iron ABC transporter permease [Roseateles sp. DAIF2]
MAALLALLSLAALLLGPGRVGPAAGWAWLSGAAVDDAEHVGMVLTQLRAPRLLAALLVGAALGAAGVLLQAVTRNPLAEPGLLGVNAGATLAIAAGLVLQGSLGALGLLGWALLGALAGSALVLLLARAGDARMSPLRLVLAGLAVAASARGFMAFLLLSSQQGLDQFRFWVLGSLARVTPELLGPGLAPLLAGLLLALLLARPLGLLALGDELAASLGGRPGLLRWAAVLAVALMAGGAVALVGPIAFLGFVAPYLARGLGGGHELGRQLRRAMLIGAALLIAADLLARLIVQPFEAPVSAVVALLGAPVLVWMVRREPTLGLETRE